MNHLARDRTCDQTEEAQAARVREGVCEVRGNVFHSLSSLLPPAPLFCLNGLNGFIKTIFNAVLRSARSLKPHTPPTPSCPVRTVDIFGQHGAKENGGEAGDGIGAEQGDELREGNSHAAVAEGEGQAQGESLIHSRIRVRETGERSGRLSWFTRGS